MRIPTNSQLYIQPAKQPDRQTDTQTHRHTDTQTYRQTDRQTDRQTERSPSIRYLPSAAGKLGTKHLDPVHRSLNPRCLESGPSVRPGPAKRPAASG